MHNDPIRVRIFPNPAVFRAWLKENHARVFVVWVGFYNQQTTKKSITYKEALDEALCFGWIDGVRKSVDEITFTSRFTPRKAKSNWSLVNLKRMRELIAAGRVAPSGLAAFENRPRGEGKHVDEKRPSGLPPELKRKFQQDKQAWEFFSSQAPWYRRTSIYWVLSAKQKETRQRRLDTLMDDSAHGRRIKQLTRKPDRTS